MKTAANDGHEQREYAESSDKQAAPDSRAFEGQVFRHDGADLIGLDCRGVERRNGVHARSPCITIRAAQVIKA